MKIKTKLEIGVFLIFLVVILVGGLLYSTSQRVSKLQEVHKNMGEITQKIAKMQALSFSYFTKPSEEAALQWDNDYYALQKILVNSVEEDQVQLHTNMRNLIENYTDIKNLFKKQTALQSDNSVPEAEKAELHSTITEKFKALLTGIDLLNQIVNSNIASSERTMTVLLSISFGCIAFALLLISFSLRSTIVKPLNKLYEAVTKISEGDLQFRPSVEHDDEFGHLTKSFNAMAEKLQNFYTDLEEKIQNRTQELFAKVNELEKAKKTMAELLQEYQKAKSEDEAILTSVGDGMIVINSMGKVTFVNKSFEDMLGWRFNEIKDKEAFQFLQIEDEQGAALPKDKKHLYQTLRENKRFSNVSGFYYICKNKTKVPIALTSSPIIVKNKTVGAVALLRDIRKEYEIQKMKNELLSFAAHQLRTPLGGIKWNLELLLDGTFGTIDPQVGERLKQMAEINTNLIGFVNELLDISRINEGKWNDKPVPTDIIPIIKAVMQELSFDLQAKNIALSFDGPEISQVNADPDYFREIMINILSNAIKYSHEKGKISIEVKATKESNRIMVTDNGIGIPKKDQQKIFSEFFRADNAISAKTEGTGLGLFMVKSYIEKWGGKVWFESEEGTFTRIYIELPKNQNNYGKK